MSLHSWLLAAAALSIPQLAVEGALVEAGSVTSVHSIAPLYDDRLGNEDGCDPAGCIGALTRVRNSCSLFQRSVGIAEAC